MPPPMTVLTQIGITPDRIRHVQPVLKRTHCRAIINWLTRHRPSPTADNLEQVKGYLQAFYHLCDIEEYERAFSLISTQLNTPTQDPLHYHLRTWGYPQVRTALYQALVDNVNHRGNESWNARVLQFLGESYQTTGNYYQAQTCLERSLNLFQTIEPDDAENVGMLLSALGEVHYALGDYPTAIEHQTRWLAIARQSNLRYGEGIALGSLGNIYESQGDYAKATSFHQQHLLLRQ